MLKTNIKRAFGTLFAANRVKYKKTTEMEEKKNIQEEEIKQQPNDCVENDGTESMEDTVENTADNTQTDDAEDKAEGEVKAENNVDPHEAAHQVGELTKRWTSLRENHIKEKQKVRVIAENGLPSQPVCGPLEGVARKEATHRDKNYSVNQQQ